MTLMCIISFFISLNKISHPLDRNDTLLVQESKKKIYFFSEKCGENSGQQLVQYKSVKSANCLRT